MAFFYQAREGFNDRIAEVGGVSIHEADPTLAAHVVHGVGDCLNECWQAAVLLVIGGTHRLGYFQAGANVVAVTGGVLADEEQLMRTIINEFASFVDKFVEWFGTHLAAN